MSLRSGMLPVFALILALGLGAPLAAATAQNTQDVAALRAALITKLLPASAYASAIDLATRTLTVLDAPSGTFLQTLDSKPKNLQSATYSTTVPPATLDRIPNEHHALVVNLVRGWYAAKKSGTAAQKAALDPAMWRSALVLPLTTGPASADWIKFGSIFSAEDRGFALTLAATDTAAFPRATVIDPLLDRFGTTQEEPYPSPFNRATRSSYNLTTCSQGVIAADLAIGNADDAAKALDEHIGVLWDSLKHIPVQGIVESSLPDGSVGMHGVPMLGFYAAFFLNNGGILDYFMPITDGIPRWRLSAAGRALLARQIIDSGLPTYSRAPDIHQWGDYFLITRISAYGGWLDDAASRLKASNLAVGLNGPEVRNGELATVTGYNVPARDAKPATWPVYPFPERSMTVLYATDQATKHFPRHLVSFRGISDRTYGTECLKSGLRLHALLPLGACFTQKDGLEYQGDTPSTNAGFTSQSTVPVWGGFDFARVPGVTARYLPDAGYLDLVKRQTANPKLVLSDADRTSWYWTADRWNSGATPFSGGVSTGSRGIYGWQQSDTQVSVNDGRVRRSLPGINVAGRRAVFFLDDAVVHLNAGYDVRHATNDTITSLEQRRSGAAATTYGIAGSTVAQTYARNAPAVRRSGITWVLHEDVGYLPPDNGQVSVLQDVQPANRGFLTAAPYDAPPPQMFSLWSEHGRTNPDLSFTWAVVPGATAATMQQLANPATRTWIVDRNDTMVQAIHLRNENWIGAVFHQAGSYQAQTIDGAVTVAVDRPCVLAISTINGVRTVTVADPLHTGYIQPTANHDTSNLDNPAPATPIVVTLTDHSQAGQRYTITPRGGVYAGETTVAPAPVAFTALDSFVGRFYDQCLGRAPDPAGLASWVSALKAGRQSGAEVARGFVLSPEFTARNLGDDAFLAVLYRAFFNRDPDAGGLAAWKAELAKGVLREDVLYGFIRAQEFANLAKTFAVTAIDPAGEQRFQVRSFVRRFYQQCLGREPDATGLENWVAALLAGTRTGADVAQGFVLSAEFANRKIADGPFLEVLYQAFFARAADPGGKAAWLARLAAGRPRAEILAGFTGAAEFAALCARYGIVPFAAGG